MSNDIETQLARRRGGLTRREIIDRQIDIVEQMENLSKRLDRIQSTFAEQSRKMKEEFERVSKITTAVSR